MRKKETTLNTDRIFLFLILFSMALICFLTFLAVGISKRNEMIRFEKEKKLVRAIVVGYGNDDAPNWTKISVMIPERNDNRSYSVDSWGTTIAEYPKGKEISVWCLEKKVLGISYPMLWLPDKEIPTPQKASGLFFVLSAISFTAMLVLIILYFKK